MMAVLNAKSLLSRAQTGTAKPARATCADEIRIEEHMGLVNMVARKWAWACGKRIDFDDLMQTGAVGLLVAKQKWDPSRSEWSTYATWQVLGAISSFVRKTLEMRSRKSADGKQQLVHRKHVSLDDLLEEYGLEAAGWEDREFVESDGEVWAAYSRGLEGRDADIAYRRLILWEDLLTIGRAHRLTRERARQIVAKCVPVVLKNMARDGITVQRDGVRVPVHLNPKMLL